MPSPFYNRLSQYFRKVGSVLRGEAEAAAVFPNAVDKGATRERLYAEFLRTHVPSSCNVLFGGFLFDLEGNESAQMDVIITNDCSPQFNFHNRDGAGKSFACVDGAIACVSIKSCLDSKELRDAVHNIATVPTQQPLGNRRMPLLNLPYYDDWPYKIVYASSGISLDTLMVTIQEYFSEHPEIPWTRTPNLIHIAGTGYIIRTFPDGQRTREGIVIPGNCFYPTQDSSDVFALVTAVHRIQQIAMASRHILFDYHLIIDSLPRGPE
jgi:hypothetical protein